MQKHAFCLLFFGAKKEAKKHPPQTKPFPYIGKA